MVNLPGSKTDKAQICIFKVILRRSRDSHSEQAKRVEEYVATLLRMTVNSVLYES